MRLLLTPGNETLWVFSSDNGAPLDVTEGAGSNDPLKGGKYSVRRRVVRSGVHCSPRLLSSASAVLLTLRVSPFAQGWEGGIRVLSFAAGGYLPAATRGTRTDAVVHIADWYATFCGLAGACMRMGRQVGSCLAAPSCGGLRSNACHKPSSPCHLRPPCVPPAPPLLAGVNATDAVAAASGLPPIDSVDLWPLLSGANASSPRWEIPVGAGELLQYPLKLLSGPQMYSGWAGPLYPNATSPAHSPDVDQVGGGWMMGGEEDG